MPPLLLPELDPLLDPDELPDPPPELPPEPLPDPEPELPPELPELLPVPASGLAPPDELLHAGMASDATRNEPNARARDRAWKVFTESSLDAPSDTRRSQEAQGFFGPRPLQRCAASQSSISCRDAANVPP